MAKFNLQAFLEFLCSVFLAATMFYLAISGKYLLYVTNRMFMYLFLASAVMFAWAISEIPQICIQQHKIHVMHCLALIMPTLLLFTPHYNIDSTATLFPDHTKASYSVNGQDFPVTADKAAAIGKKQADFSVNSNNMNKISASKKNDPNILNCSSLGTNKSNISKSSDTINNNVYNFEDNKTNFTDKSSSTTTTNKKQLAIKNNKDTKEHILNTNNVSSIDIKENSPAEAKKSDSPNDNESSNIHYDDSIIEQFRLKKSKDGSIDVTDEMFYPWISEINKNLKRYENINIKIKGFIFKDPSNLSANEFVISRLLMYCCYADLTPCGLVCEYDKSSSLKKGKWVTVTGVIHIGKYDGQDEPQITVTDITPAKKPKYEYVYPYE